ncbi:hypothetical protein EDB89DRAFT_1888493 [Lactarius sanguifluus]|nr:hypothetical protein EDB89DRAFT_1888493 [Lactarius sanguifluus]
MVGFSMDPSQANSREYQQQAVDAEIKSLERSIRALKLRRNALTPISSLPTEVIAAIFSILRLVASSFTTLGESPDRLAWLRVTHVCHYWREIALNQPLFWSHVNFTTLTSAGVAETLARAKTAPLYLEARVPAGWWDDARFSVFQKELQAHVSHICHLDISAEEFRLREILEGLVSPAPTLEHLSLSSVGHWDRELTSRVLAPNTLFDDTAPRLSHLELHNCDISWKSQLMKGLKYLEIRMPTKNAGPSLSYWLDALDEMPQLTTLDLHSASPVAPPGALLPSGVERTITLPSLAHLNISSVSARDCGLALAHLLLPALTKLCFTATSCCQDGSDVREILPYVARHAHGPQDSQPLQSVVVRNHRACAEIFVGTLPNVDVKSSPITLFDAMLSARVVFSITGRVWSPETHAEVFDAAMMALPIDSLVTLTSQLRMSPLNKQSWLRHAPRWSLLQCVHLGAPAARGFTEMLLEDRGERECTLLPSLTELVLVDIALSARRTLRLCDALTKRVEQGVPLETLDLSKCSATSRAIELLSEIVVDVLGPETTFSKGVHMGSMWNPATRGLFVEDDSDSSWVEDDHDEDDSDTGSDDDAWPGWENWGSDSYGDEYGEDEMDYW